jgi:predicted MFS family arabinose efflux permease
MSARGLDRDGSRTGLSGSLAAMVTAMVIASVVALGAAAIVAFDRAVEPELANRTRLIGSIVRSEIQRALELGIPFDAIVGLDRYLSDALEKFEEVDRISVTTASGQSVAVVERPKAPSIFEGTGSGEVIAFRQTTFALPILEGNELVGEITVEISPLFVQTRLRDVFLDVMVIALVATLVALELALTVAVASVGKPLDRVSHLLGEQREGNFLHRIRPGGLGGLGRAAARLNDHAEDLAERLTALPAGERSRIGAAIDVRIAEGRPPRLRLSEITDIRLPLFLFSVATEIAAAFLPLYARAADRPPWLSPELAAAAPLVLYLVAVAMMSPFGGTLARRFGARRVFLASVPPAVLALAAMGFSGSVVGIAFWRGVMAVFYATATIACQEYAIRAAADRGSGRPVGAFIAVVYGGVFCGSALGGVLAGRFGFEAAFVSGAAIAILSGLLAMVAMRGRAGDPEPAPASGSDGSAPQRWFGARFLALLFGIVVPMNATTAIFIWYLTPLILAAAGSGPAEIARVVMLYYLAVVLFGPTVASLSDGRVGPVPLVISGALASGAALLSLTVWSGFWAVVAAVAGLGVGHTAMRAPLYALALGVTGGSGPALSTLRVIERIGATLGLAASAMLLGDIGAERSIRALGTAVLAGLVLYVIIELGGRSRSG